jgi:hypothetical protein
MPETVISVLGEGKAIGPKYNADEALLESNETDVDESDELEDSGVVAPEEEDEEVDEEVETELEEEDKEAEIPFNRPTIRDIKAKYPDFFKDFPDIKEAYFREIEFTKFFPTVADAQEAFNENEAFTVLSDAALDGNPEPIFDSIGKTDTKALETFTLSFLPMLYKKNPELYADAVHPVLQNLVQHLYKDKDENTRNAAIVLAQFLFGDADGEAIAQGKKSIAKNLNISEEQKKQKETREAKLTGDFRGSVGRVQGSVMKHLETLVLKNPAYDPNRVFSPFLRKQGASEVINRIQKALESDKGHMTVMAARWKRARANGYTGEDESKIISTYLARAKSLIPDACAKVSAAMMGTKVKAANIKQERVDRTSSPRRENFSGRTATNGSSRNSKDYNKMTDMEILES